MPPPISSSNTLTITNPLILYRALLATKQIDPDPAQHRLAIHLQALYHRLKDYSPQNDYVARLKAINQVAGESSEEEADRPVAVPGHPLRRNPLFEHLFPKKGRKDTLALTRVLTNHEEAIHLNSPRGMLLHGEVGTGKSMLLDLLADSLPNRKKRRWHFNTFMLETLARLEQLRQSRSESSTGVEPEHSLLWLAKDMIEKSPILFLDEFQLPDRAASKILSNLLTTFFQLGGVLIASSNRMPDELAKASGTSFAPPREGFVRNWLGLRHGAKTGDIFKGEYGGFVEVLKARCEIEVLEGRDWRRREAEEVDRDSSAAFTQELDRELGGSGKVALGSLEPENEHESPEIMPMAAVWSGVKHEDSATDRSNSAKGTAPKNYILMSSDSETAWGTMVKKSLPPGVPTTIPWEATSLLVYGRRVPVPQHLAGVCSWTFPTLCGGMFGPADYITMASTFHTFVLDEVPVLSLLQKNEARRMITLLDALYEARCKLIIRAEAGPDELFFPETSALPMASNGSAPQREVKDGGDAVYPETISEIYQDQTSPFRSNVSAYADEPKTGYDPDQDSDFGLTPGKGNEIGRQVDFGMASSFTGEDERFAYKRARSRLWEMCGVRWHARSEPGWWRPLPLEVRRWERSSGDASKNRLQPISMPGDVRMGGSIELDKPAGLQGKELDERERGTGSPFRQK